MRGADSEPARRAALHGQQQPLASRSHPASSALLGAGLVIIGILSGRAGGAASTLSTLRCTPAGTGSAAALTARRRYVDEASKMSGCPEPRLIDGGARRSRSAGAPAPERATLCASAGQRVARTSAGLDVD